jgi:hypothetical protein
LNISTEPNRGSRREVFGRGQFKPENIMAGLYLGIAVTGVNALIAMGLVIAIM